MNNRHGDSYLNSNKLGDLPGSIMKFRIVILNFTILILLSLIGYKIVKNFNWISNVLNDPRKKTQIEYQWNQTGITFNDLEPLIVEKNCYVSKKYFLACFNALETMASLTGTKISITGKIIDNNHLSSADSTSASNATTAATTAPTTTIQKKIRDGIEGHSEIKRLQRWSHLYESKNFSSIDINKLVSELKEKIKSSSNESFITAKSLNAFLSVYKDPHSYIIPKSYYEDVIANSQPSFISFGFNLSQHNKKTIFSKIYSGTELEKKGIRRGAVLESIDGLNIKDLSLNDVIKILKNKEEVNFQILQKKQKFNLSLSKVNQTIPAVQSELLTSPKTKKYIQLTVHKISEGICTDTKKIIEKHLKEDVSGLILDLRDNSGGSMDEILCLSGLFIGDKKIYELRFFNSKLKNETFYSDQEQIYFGPMVILINENTASSAEILAGVLQHYQRGTLIGNRTFGKGTFQEGDDWLKNPKVLLFQTKGLFYLPSGKTPQLKGVSPDIEIVSELDKNIREEDQYLSVINPADYENSLKPLERITSHFYKEKYSHYNSKKSFCKSSRQEFLTEDQQLGKAQNLLDCSL